MSDAEYDTEEMARWKVSKQYIVNSSEVIVGALEVKVEALECWHFNISLTTNFLNC